MTPSRAGWTRVFTANLQLAGSKPVTLLAQLYARFNGGPLAWLVRAYEHATDRNAVLDGDGYLLHAQVWWQACGCKHRCAAPAPVWCIRGLAGGCVVEDSRSAPVLLRIA